MLNVHAFVRKPDLLACASSRNRSSAHSPVPNATTVTILFGEGSPGSSEEMIKAVFHGSGYRCENIPTPEVAELQAGKEFGNNGQCNPTYFTVGNLVRYLQKLEQQGETRQQIIGQLRLLHRRLLWPVPLWHV